MIIEHILEERVVSSRGKANHRAVKRYKPRYPRKRKSWPKITYNPVVIILSKAGAN